MGMLDGKVAVITSAGSGIARGTAVRLARDGDSVCIVDIDEDGARETASSVREFGRAASSCTRTSPSRRRHMWHMQTEAERRGRLQPLIDQR
jgi:NAD(P)-dependent dehydrogenase (short-subunit alcohol dehydrogenase family)